MHKKCLNVYFGELNRYVYPRFAAAEEFVVVFDIFHIMMRQIFFIGEKIWTAGRPIQHLDTSTMKPCCCNS